MAVELNPFDEGGTSDAISDVAEEESRVETPKMDETKLPTVQKSEKLTLDAIAKRLLEENFVLTALELHTELLESGRELRRLNDYFSNPANFETTSSRPDFSLDTLR